MSGKTVFFCGHNSPYGIAHLNPVINKFDVKAVVIGTHERWDDFRRSLSGRSYYQPRADNVTQWVAGFVPTRLKRILTGEYQVLRDLRKTLHRGHIPLIEFYDANGDVELAKIRALDADLFLSAAYPQIFSKKLLEIPRSGAVNFHPSLLPKYRGAHPHFWQIVNGETTGGLTAHFMTENLDDGDVIAQISYHIDDCTYSELYEKMISHTPSLVHEVRAFFDDKTSKAEPQKPHEATYFRNDREIHSRIFWNTHTSREIHNLIRTGRAFCFIRERKVTLTSSLMTESNRNLTNDVRVENGTIVDVGSDGMAVKTIDGCINVKSMKYGLKILTHLQWAQTMNIRVGEKFD